MTASDGKAPVLEFWKCRVPLHCHYSQIHPGIYFGIYIFLRISFLKGYYPFTVQLNMKIFKTNPKTNPVELFDRKSGTHLAYIRDW